jgi:hypothetical protein
MSTEGPNAQSLSSETQESEDAYLSQLRRSMAGFLAHKISFSLFEAGKNQQLRSTLEHLVQERLREQQIALEPHLLERLINDIYEGLPVQKPVAKNEDDELTPEKLRPLVASYLAQHISNDLLSPGHETALSRRIQLLVDEKLALDQLQVSDQVRYQLMTQLCQGMNVEPPAPPESLQETQAPAPLSPPTSTLPVAAAFSSPPATPTPLSTPRPVPAPPQIPAAPKPPTPPTVTDVVASAVVPPLLPPTPPERSPTKKVPRLSMRAHPKVDGLEFEEITFTEEHKRQLLFTLGTKLDPAVMSTGDQKKIYHHIMSVLDQVSAEENLDLDDEIKELLLNGLLTGEGLEFQL